MTRPSIPVDLLNPGQVFACLGFVEAAEVLIGPCSSQFECTSSSTEGRFFLDIRSENDPFAEVIEFLCRCSVTAMVPAGGDAEKLSTKKWSIPQLVVESEAPFPMPLPTAPAMLPAQLVDGSRTIVVDHWADTTVRDNVKFWAGAGGYPGAALLRDALDLVRTHGADAVKDPFAVAAEQKSSFRFDWRRDYVPLGVGFSLNAHPTITPRGRPWVEILAAIGLTHARPRRVTRRDKLLYTYSVSKARLPTVLQRAMLGGTSLPFESRDFTIRLSWPGKEGQARCITAVTENPVHV